MTAHVRQRYELIQDLPWKTIAASKCMSRYVEQRTRPEECSADLFQLCSLHLCTCALC